MPKRTQGHYLPYLAKWRGRKFWTQGRLASEADVSLGTIQYLESEKQPHPANYSTIVRLATALGIEPEILVNVDPTPEEAKNKAG